MGRTAFVTAVGLVLLTATASPAWAQAVTADVRTFSGQTYRLTDASFEVLYSIVPPRRDEGPSDTAATTGARAPMLFGSASAIGNFIDKQPEPLLGHRQSETLTMRSHGVETKIPLAQLTTLTFTRLRMLSALPPHVAPEHYRHAATAVLSDGTRLEGDYVNLGTAFLRGQTPYGRVDIPWDQIETVRFTR